MKELYHNELKNDQNIKNQQIEEQYLPDIDISKQFLSELNKQLLTAEEEKALFQRIEQGDEEAKTEVIEKNIRLVVSIAKIYTNRGLEFLDLVNEGCFGLIKAIAKFDIAKGYRFSTYATRWIRQAITRAIFDKGRVIRVSVHTMEHVNKVKRYINDYYVRNGINPSMEEIQQQFNYSDEKMDKIFDVIINKPSSLNTGIGEDEDTELIDLLEDRESIPLEEIAAKGELVRIIDESSLTERERKVLYLRFGVIDNKTRTLEEVGKIFNITRERVRQIEAKALRKLRNNIYVKEYYNTVGSPYKIKEKNKTRKYNTIKK